MSEVLSATGEQLVLNAKRIDDFLKDEAIKQAFGRMERRFYEEFVAAESAEARVKAWAKANTLREFERELHSLMDAGEVVLLANARKANNAKNASR